jgi:curved DNA-binding protein
MDYYSILGVSRNASEQDIRKAYKKKSMQHHPDRGGNEEEFKKINEAYQTLRDSQKRQQYDNPGPDFSFNSQHFQQGRNPFAGTPFEDIFGRNPAGQHGRGPTPRNRDITIQAKIDLEEVLLGKNLIIQYTLSNRKLETVTVDVPPGARHGDTIKYQGLGDNGDPRFPRGDLNVRMHINKHRQWARDGDNLIAKIDTNVFDFLTGGAIIVKTLDKKELELKIPKGTQPGQTFNIPGYGIPNLQTGKRGNVYITVNAHIPIIKDESLIHKVTQLKNELKDL